MKQENQLQQVIDLIEKTGDKAIVLDGNKPAYVLMGLGDYERLILGKSEVQGLTEDELLDKINREIAVWKSEQEKIKEIEDEYSGLEKDWEPKPTWRDGPSTRSGSLLPPSPRLQGTGRFEDDDIDLMDDRIGRDLTRDEYDFEREVEMDMERDMEKDMDRDRHERFEEDVFGKDIELPLFSAKDEIIPDFDFEDKKKEFEIPGVDDKPKFEEDKFYVEPME